MRLCCRPVGPQVAYFPNDPCPLDAPLADSVPWEVDEADLVAGIHGVTSGPNAARYSRATKTVGSVVITGVVTNASAGRAFTTPGVPAATSGTWASSIGVFEGSGQAPAMQFSVSVPQPQVQMKVEDIDSQEGTGRELVRIGNQGHPARRADVEQFYVPGSGQQGSPNRFLTYGGATGDYEVHQGDENALQLTWRNTPWGDGGNGAPPVGVQYVNLAGAARGSAFDFSGPIYQTECSTTPRRARLIQCCDCELDAIARTINNSFEEPVVGNGFTFVPEANMPGWEAESAGSHEVWRNFNPNGNTMLLPYPNGDQVLEVRGPVGSTGTFQDVATPSREMEMAWGYWHGKRFGGNETETIVLELGPSSGPLTQVDTHTHPAGSQPWVRREGTWIKPAGVTSVRIRLDGTVSTGTQAGNLIDDVSLTGDSCLRYVDIETGENLTSAQIATIRPLGPADP